jgi:hypothetical protein
MKNRKALKTYNAGTEGRTQVELIAEIRRRAYELYDQRGRQNGHALDDWKQAEAEVLEPERRPTV